MRELTVVVSFLSVQDPRERPADARAQADAAHKVFADPASDFVGVLNLWRDYRAAHEALTQSKLRDWCSRHFLSFMRMREWSELHRQVLQVVGELGWKLATPGADATAGAGGPERTAVPGGGAAVRSTARGEVVRVVARAGRKGSRKPAPPTPTVSAKARGSEVAVPAVDETAASRLFENIHRSLLAGLPTQVGRKDEQGVYFGPRERRFHVFPGSALGKAPPNRVFSAQILDIGGRVWGMNNARVDPLWIEQQASHLLRTTCRDPHWSKKRGAVVAFEQVSLFGLVLVEKRPVVFQAQDPQLAHAIFVREALVRGELDSRADFVRANQRVLQQAEEVEAKQRREGLIRHEDDLVAFFDGKLPADIASVRALDAWYRKAAPAEQAALRWSLDDVLGGDAALDAGAFPATLALAPAGAPGRVAPGEGHGPQHYRVEYRFTPGDAADGVTLHVPLAMLNAVPPARCQWLVPGLLADKVAELIRGLPKALRRNYVPAPDFARAFVAAEAPRDEPLDKALAAFLTRTTGVPITAAHFADVQLPAHFRMRYRLYDDTPDGGGKTVATSRDLAALRAQWQGQARVAFAHKTDVELTRENVATWDFDEIPAQVRADAGVLAFPALVDMGQAVALRVFERGDEARAAHVGGVVRLLRNALAGELKQARRRLPISRTLALRHAPLGNVDGLREDIVEGGFGDILQRCELDVRSAAAFDSLRAQCQRDVFPAAVARLGAVEPIVDTQAELKPWMQPLRTGSARASYADLNEQFAALLAFGFARDLPLARLEHLPRYLKAMRLRAERLRQDPARDQQRMLQVMPYWRQYLTRLAAGTSADALAELRWLIEEWRVSLFAQELKTAEPVSAKRLAKALDELR